ncbi:D-lactaldehyde dehydrogenase [Coniophora puteana RWD-64-598 SS2]|uniref:D-lactaldehyde dehydrogenase n=1 Tax=Coniophora puteana (strain RWD-64-598) TaxID=741705 RepID=A0A5M3MX77_CONPW|nr:D-lactaldehyde dehydrogenase [Coniophora puteana RWD-64-598 SS2]EIW83698.1 D-lactaldehyde dehydrogenase [Coniophora puteana RWD-64-598 SS2]
MPAINANEQNLILVTGANGFIAAWTVRILLERGYAVRGAVRSSAKGKHLQETFRSYGEKFELAFVEDITKDGAFDEAVKDVDGVIHTASPATFSIKNPDDMIKPAVNGTVSILKSIIKFGSKVKRVAVTSTGAAIVTDSVEPRTFSELDWNEECLKNLERLGSDVSPNDIYAASKVLAERGAWDFWKDNRPTVQWDLAVLHPAWIFGPPIHEVSDPASLNMISKIWYENVVHPTSSGASNKTLATLGGCWADVRDCAEAHVRALEIPEAAGQRIIISTGPWKMQDWRAYQRVIPPFSPLPKGNPGAGSANSATVHLINYDMTVSNRVLGMRYRTMAETTRDTLQDHADRGW